MEILVKTAQFLLSLSILIILHELGHFLFAKLFKTRVEKFYLFFNPWFSIFKVKRGETEYGLGWLPLGGYVKISGMIDESMDKEQLKQPPQPFEFRSKPAWQRLLIMVGGVLVNFVLAMVIYILILFFAGQSYIPNANITEGVVWDTLALENGFQNGDKIVSVGGEQVEKFRDITKYIIENQPAYIKVERDGKLIDINLPPGFTQQIIARDAIPLVDILVTTKIDSVLEGYPAKQAGMKKGDMILSINNEETKYFSDVVSLVQGNVGQKISVEVLRNSDTLVLPMSVSQKGMIGIAPGIPKEEIIEYSFSESIPAGIKYGLGTISSYFKQMKYVFTKEGVKKVGGFGTIGGLFPSTWDWLTFWTLTAFLSIILAVMNILPIPALDGGHVMFLLYEMVTGRKPGDKFLEYAQIAGMVILLSLLILANGNDFIKWINR